MNKPTPSETETLKQKARWRLLLRNGKFREEFNALQLRAPARPLYWKEDAQFSSKWGVMVTDLLQDKSLPSLTRESIDFYESLFERVGNSSAIWIWDAYNHTYECEEGILYSVEWKPPEERGQRFILDVDFSKINLDLALRIIETELRSAVLEARGENLRRKKTTGTNTPRQKRERLDKLEFQLKVFDMAQAFYEKKKSKLFNFVAINLSARPSTVKSAYWVACFKIGVEGIRERTPSVATSVAPCPFDQCPDPKCRAAQAGTDLYLMVRGLCEQHKALFLETQPGLLGSTGHDLSRIEHAQEKRRSGRRYVKHSSDSAE